MGVDANGEPGPNYQPGIEPACPPDRLFRCRGSLTKELFGQYNLRDGVDPQTYGIGIKELWEMRPEASAGPDDAHRGLAGQVRRVRRFIPVSPGEQPGCGWLRGRAGLQEPAPVALRGIPAFKTHPEIRKFFEGGRRISYGARALNEGGYQSVPKLTFPGGLLIGDTAASSTCPRSRAPTWR
jgi:electron-transferring-flavoprotein dehydrogenase